MPPYQDAFQVCKRHKSHEQQEVGQSIMRDEKHEVLLFVLTAVEHNIFTMPLNTMIDMQFSITGASLQFFRPSQLQQPTNANTSTSVMNRLLVATKRTGKYLKFCWRIIRG